MYATDFHHWIDMFIKGIIVILTLAKAFYIVSIFMHLGDEIRNMIMTIAVPLLLFVWFIAAFLWDGNEFKNLRNRYDKTKQEQLIKHNQEIKAADTTRHRLD
jgi:cytochrome c oxidase subunit IV